MVSYVTTVSFQGIEALPVDVQVQIAPVGPIFAIVGLPGKAASESRECIDYIAKNGKRMVNVEKDRRTEYSPFWLRLPLLG